jgi:hypothetical protein
MDKPKITPKDFFLWLTAMAFFYASVFAFIALIFSYLNYAFPDRLSYYSGDPYSGGISYEMATLIVLFPMRVIHRSIEVDPTRGQVWVRHWALYLTLFFAGVTVAADLITLIMYFFNGDVTLRFALKVLVILLVAGAGFLHFLADLKGFWEKNPTQSRMMGYAAGALIIITIVLGFFIVGTPWQARQYRFDGQKVSDLQNIQYQVVNYWQRKQVLPGNLTDLNDSISGYIAPVDPGTQAPYEYKTTGAKSFELCATFGAASQSSESAYPRTVPMAVYPDGSVPAKGDTWWHNAGHACFERTIDPALYPPLTKVQP